MGLITSGDSGAETVLEPDTFAERVQAHHDAAKAASETVVSPCHSGPTAWPDDAEYIFPETAGVVGFSRASNLEGRPTEDAIETQAREFKQIEL